MIHCLNNIAPLAIHVDGLQKNAFYLWESEMDVCIILVRDSDIYTQYSCINTAI